MPNVTVTQPSTIKVQVGGKPTTVQSINYGSRTLKGASDLNLTGANTGDVIVYNVANNDFTVTGIEAAVRHLDGGYF